MEHLAPRHATSMDVSVAPAVFFGNLHSHTDYSDGSGTPREAFLHARDVANLDFLAVTEHNHDQAGEIADQPELYEGPDGNALIPVANQLTEEGVFVALYGQEFSTISSGNHVNVFDVPRVIDESEVGNGDFAALLDSWIPQNLDSTGQEAIVQLNHPWTQGSPANKEYGRDDFGPGSNAERFEKWRTSLDRRARLIEVINGPSHSDGSSLDPATVNDSEYRRYLNMGFHLAPSANQDNHQRTWGSITDARTAVIAPKLAKTEIMEAMRNRHAYATLDRNLRIVGKVQDKLMGSILHGVSDGDLLKVELSISDDDEPSGRYWIEVYVDRIDGRQDSTSNRASQLATYGPVDVTTDAPNWKIDDLIYEGWDYLYVRVLQGDEGSPERQAWLAPVWFEG